MFDSIRITLSDCLLCSTKFILIFLFTFFKPVSYFPMNPLTVFSSQSNTVSLLISADSFDESLHFKEW